VESITVLPRREPNETDRYLSTGEAEIRISGTHLPDGFPMGEVDFDLNAQEYNLNCTPPVFRLSVFLPDSGWPVWFHFPCNSVTYSFHEFTGDSGIQKSRDHAYQIFARLLEKGHGYAYRFLQLQHPNVRPEYSDLLIYAACHDQRYDHQCDDSHAHYVMDLLSLLDCDSLISGLFEKQWREIWKDEVNPNDFQHCIEMILENHSHPLAEETLAYLENKLTEISNEEKLEILLRKNGKLPEEDFSNTELRPVQPAYTMERIIEICRTDIQRAHPARFRQFFKKTCTSNDLTQLLDAAHSEKDPQVRGQMYAMFSQIDFPGDPEEIISMARDFEYQLTDESLCRLTAMNLQRAVSRLRHPAVLAYRDELLKKAETAANEMKNHLLCHAIDHWVNNYTYSEEGDEALYDLLNNLPKDKYGPRHHAAFALTNSRMYDEPFDDPRAYQHLHWVVDDTYCPNCRRKALEIWHRFDKLHIFFIQDALHDSDSATRALAQQWLNEQ